MEKEHCKDVFKKNNIRSTKQRHQILNIIKENKIPLTASEISELLEEKNINIRLSTIYRNLKLFTEKGILRQLNFYEDEKRYEILNKKHHQHLICVNCGEILPIKCPLAQFEKKIEKETSYQIKKHDMELYGVCPECQDK